MDDLSELQHPAFARRYRRIGRWSDRRGGLEHRRRLLAGLSGTVVEVGAGNGLNFPHYPATVESVLAIEPDASLRSDADLAASQAPRPITVAAGRAEELPARDREYDAVVLSLVLCSVADPAAALGEAVRVLKPGGVLRFYEHVGSARRPVRLLERLVNPVWSRLAGGCHLDRDTVAAIQSAGFEIGQLESFGFFGVAHVIGVARAPRVAR